MARARDLEVFHRTLGELCRAEMPLGRALRLLASERGAGPLAATARALAADVDNGSPFAEAYRRAPFPPLYAALVEAGLAAGDLPAALAEVARHAAFAADVEGRLRRSLLTPLVTGVVVLFLATGIWAEVTIGRLFLPIFEGLGAELPLPTRIVVAQPHLFVGAQVALLAVIVVGAGFFGLLTKPVDGPVRGPFGLPIPLLGGMRSLAALASLSAGLALCLRRGLPLARAAALEAHAGARGPLRAEVAVFAGAAAEGLSLGESLRRAGLFPPALAWVVTAAEQRGEAAAALEDAAEVFRDRLERASSALETVGGPIAELGIGLVVLGIGLTMLSLFLPIMGILKAVHR